MEEQIKARRRRASKIRKNTISLRKKISQLSKATDLWTVFLTYDPVKMVHQTLISTPRHSWAPSKKFIVQHAIDELSNWPREAGAHESEVYENVEMGENVEVYENTEDENADEDDEGENFEVGENVDSDGSLMVNQQLHSSIPNAEAQDIILEAYEQPGEKQLPSFNQSISIAPHAR